MAGTRGIARFKGEQLNNEIMRDNHFDADNKISETFIDIDFNAHREILEDTKIDVFVQVNDVAVAGLDEIDVTSSVGARAVSTGVSVEGVVLSERVQLRKVGTDTPIADDDADVVYGRLTESGGTFTLSFFSLVGGSEAPFTFVADHANIDYRFVVRTNLSVIPVDTIVKGGAGFVEGATDAKAYMNLIQLMKDVYGAGGTLDNDGNANLATSIQGQINKEVTDRTAAVKALSDSLATTAGAGKVGVITDPNYTGLTVQAVLVDLAARIKAASDTSGGRMDGIEDSIEALDARLTKVETADEEEVYEATGGETEYLLQSGRAKPKTVLLFINGQAQAPGVNFEYIRNAQSEIIGFNFAPDTLKVTNGIPDVLLIKYEKIL